MENALKQKYTNLLMVWKEQTGELISIIERCHDRIIEFDESLKKLEIIPYEHIIKEEIDFLKLLKKLNVIIDVLIQDSTKVLKLAVQREICLAYSCIDGIGILRMDRIFEKATDNKQYKQADSMIQQYIRQTQSLIEEFELRIKENPLDCLLSKGNV